MSEKNESRDWELSCDNCNGSGYVFVERQVAERKTDVQEFKEECECCEGRGFTIAYEDIPGIAKYVKSCRAHSAPGDAPYLQALADKVVIMNATGDPDLFLAAVKDLLAAVRTFHPAPAAGDARKPGIDIEAAAQKMAECMDYPWAHMPEQGRLHMRKYAQAVIDAALAAQVPQQGEA